MTQVTRFGATSYSGCSLATTYCAWKIRLETTPMRLQVPVCRIEETSESLSPPSCRISYLPLATRLFAKRWLSPHWREAGSAALSKIAGNQGLRGRTIHVLA